MKMECTSCHITLDKEELINKFNNVCPMCHEKNSYIEKYIMDIKRISNDSDFIQAMIKLHDEDPIEYQLKMSQFKANLKQQEQVQESKTADNAIHCPTCNSTNVNRISTTAKATNTILFGIFGTKRHKTFHCNNCKYEW